MDMPLQLRATLVAKYADAIPAVVDGGLAV
jgi:hypothetical protein